MRFFFSLQLIVRQELEDGPNPEATWGADRTESDPEDFDDDDNMPISAARQPASVGGNSPALNPLRAWPDDDEDSDCYILEVLDPKPLSFTLPPGYVESEGETSGAVPPAPKAAKKKRATAADPEAAPKKKRKLRKTAPTEVG